MEDKHKEHEVGRFASFQNGLELEVPFSFSYRSPFVYKKTEKLVVATNLVVGLIKDNQPLVDTLRSKTFELLTQVSKGLMGEFAFLYKTIVEEGATLVKGDIFLTKDFFAEETPEFHKGQYKGQLMSFTKNTAHRDSFRHSTPMNQMNPPSRLAQEGARAAMGEGSSGALNVVGVGRSDKTDRSDRRDRIVGLIKERGEVGIADLLGTLKGVGGKTIQRELLAMVAEGVLKKQGERRWSRYSIV